MNIMILNWKILVYVSLFQKNFHLSLGFCSFLWPESGSSVLPLKEMVTMCFAFSPKLKDMVTTIMMMFMTMIMNGDDEDWNREPCRRSVRPEDVLNLVVDHVNDLLHLLQKIL